MKNRSGYVERSVTPVGTNASPPFVKVDVAGNGVEILCGWRKGYRLYAGFNNGTEELIDREISVGERLPIKFDYLKVTTSSTTAELADTGIDERDVVLGIWQDQRVLRDPGVLIAASGLVQHIKGGPQNLAISGAVGSAYTIWDDATNYGSPRGIGGELAHQRFQQGHLQARALVSNFWVASATASSSFQVELWAYMNPESFIANEPLLIETWSSVNRTSGGTAAAQYYVVHSQQGGGTVRGQYGQRWPAFGGKLVVSNLSATVVTNVYWALALSTI